VSRDWRLPENRWEGFLRFYEFQLHTKGHPGAVYMLLPAVADALELDEDGRAWLVWLNGNTQNIVTSLLLLEAAPSHHEWPAAVDFWNTHFRDLEWDTDRRHQKSKFGEATETWADRNPNPAQGWFRAAQGGWPETWKYATSQPYMGRLSAWSMTEYARILMGPAIPDASTFLLEDRAGSRSHRNGLAVIAGYDGAEHWDADVADLLGVVPELQTLSERLLAQAVIRTGHPDVSRLTMESALCTYKSHYKPNRRYPNVYHDMMYNRIRRAEERFGDRFEILWKTRREQLPAELLVETNPARNRLTPEKQNWFRETGEFHYLHLFFKDMEPSGWEQRR
jgi:hypothetical protein